MKKSILLICIALLAAGGSVFAAPADSPELKTASTSGVITAVSGERVTIAGKGFVDEIVLLAVAAGYVLDGATGRALDISALSPGIEVTAYYAPNITRSLPPQAKAIAVVTGAGPETARYFKAGQVERLPGGIRVLNDNRDQYIAITGEVFSQAQEITAGGEFLAWYPVSTLSMPGQATALRVLPLNRARPDIVVDLRDGSVMAGGRKVRPEPLKGEGDALFLPLRAICENFGYKVEWEKESRTAFLLKDNVFMSVTADDNYCGSPLSPIALKSPPLLRNGVLYAPVEFFARALGYTVKIDK
ncbi:MAG: copper amine oxidase N-terminal domain-containing protein [Acidaminococcales bacterium]|jgi:hypothetical protein|nr:copper amine oxidase N-terminal domain-containing protein [Acidaminococcales bacterium]